jgi:hypothetical protein
VQVVQIPCGGWRRPHSYYLGDIPDMQNCFAYVKVVSMNTSQRNFSINKP